MSKVKVNSVEVRKEDMPVNFEPLLKVELAATMMGLKPPTLYGWIEDGLFEGLKLGKKAVRVRPEAIRAYLQAAMKRAQGKVIDAKAA